MYDYPAIGKRIRARRQELKMTQENLAEKAGRSTSFIGHIERGTRILSVETLVELAYALECSADLILGINEFAKEDNLTLILNRALEIVKNN